LLARETGYWQIPAPQLVAAHSTTGINWGDASPHCAKHSGAATPVSMQGRMHANALAHIGSSRHVSVWAQQLAARQLPQAVPSDAQVGAAAAQMPLAQVSEQHSENSRQGPPLAVHAGGPQVPTPASPFVEQISSQHCEASVQVAPLGWHMGAPQVPTTLPPVIEQIMSQHCEESVQNPPAGWHVVGPQTP
jgi:hypothetical protein